MARPGLDDGRAQADLTRLGERGSVGDERVVAAGAADGGPGRGDAQGILAFYAERRIVERSLRQPGCRQVDVGVRHPDRGAVVVTAVWDSPAAYKGWLANPARAADVSDLLPLLAGPLESATRFDLVDPTDVAFAAPDPLTPS